MEKILETYLRHGEGTITQEELEGLTPEQLLLLIAALAGGLAYMANSSSDQVVRFLIEEIRKQDR